ncbi:ABC transporter substrate-binding protein [Nocardia neocaledoniensis]|uniref:ABC transporter substrate-binding protein n=1 Tax=Nocardia neocaledoniensis TaxID=236511 RepID=UPI0033DFC2E7
MAFSSRLRRAAAIPVAAGLVLTAACSSGDSGTEPGVTSAPCPGSTHKDRGCIYLGVLSDLANGPFTALGASMNEGQLAFWNTVNEAGGIGGYDIDITTYTRNTSLDPRTHRTAYTEIEPHVLALAMSFGTGQTIAMLNQMDADDMVSVAATQWSGWNYRSADRNLVLSAGYSYCTEAVTGLDWFTRAHYAPRNIAVVAYRGNYGGDYASGALKWAIANGATIADRIDTGPNGEVGNQDGPVEEVLAAAPDLVMLATGPAETAEIVGKLVKSGYTGRFLGSLPTWNAALLQTPAAPALTALYNYTTPVDSWSGTSLGAQHARAAVENEPSNFGYSLGWAISYPLKALLKAAANEGELTRAGLRRTITGLRPDGEGMVAIHPAGAAGPDLDLEWSSVFEPDKQAPMGARAVEVGYQGATLGKLSLHEPCTRL